MKFYYFLMNLLFPPKCILCGKLLEKQEQDLCRACRADGPEYPIVDGQVTVKLPATSATVLRVVQ